MATDFIISKELLRGVEMSQDQLKIELAVYLYAQKKISMGQARKLAELDQISFQKELAKREVYIHFGIEDLKEDLTNLGISFE